ncbi:MAG: LCP family protein [Eubacteriales bacterium]|nr:LCP family protein [Eubacteriales bacterium]
MSKRKQNVSASKEQGSNNEQHAGSGPLGAFMRSSIQRIQAIFRHREKPGNTKENAIEKPKKKKKPPEKRLFHRPFTVSKIVRYCLLAALLAAVVILSRFIYVTMINPSAAFGDTANVSAQTTAQPTVTTTSAATPSATATATLSPEELLALQADMDFMQDRVNILLTGIDYSEEREGRTDFRTDTILLLCIDFSTENIDLLSIPRDSYADIAYTDRRWKINGAYMSAGGAEGEGFECLMETVSTTIGGIPVNYYIGVEMQAVKDIVDILGGVWYDVDYEINMNGRHLDTGYQLLDGQAVLDYCRARKGITSGTDIDRIDRQQRLLMEVFNQMKDASLLEEIPEMYQTVQSEVYTNLNFEQIAALALFALNLDLETECDRYTLQGEYMNAYNATYYVLDHTYTEEVIKEIFGEDVTLDIDWTYSINYVKNDVAIADLTGAIEDLNALIEKNEAVLSEELLEEAYALLESAHHTLSKEDTDDMDDMTDKLEDMYDTLYAYIQNPPEPSPSPSASASASPSATDTSPP